MTGMAPDSCRCSSSPQCWTSESGDRRRSARAPGKAVDWRPTDTPSVATQAVDAKRPLLRRLADAAPPSQPVRERQDRAHTGRLRVDDA